MPLSHHQIDLADAQETADFAAALGQRLVPGDTILLSGDVGAGKTHFARALIQSRLGKLEDVPSPTFTLVQTYETPGAEIWHADLYRLTSTLEIEELGLAEAFEQAICLVEWPDRLGEMKPGNALSIGLEEGATETGRRMHLGWQDAKWQDRLAPWIDQ